VAGVTALAAAFCPPALVVTLLAALALVLSAPVVGGGRLALAAMRVAALSSVIAVVFLFPWPLAYLGPSIDAGSFGLASRPALGIDDVLTFHVGPFGGGRGTWGLLIAAAAPLFLATGPRLVWATRGWMLAVVGWAATWLPTRFAPGTPALAPEVTLVVAAFGIAIALGVSVSVLRDGIHRFHFGWRQPAAIAAGVALVLPMLAFLGDTFDGRWGTPRVTWSSTLSFAANRSDAGAFRLLWVGDPAMLPVDPVTIDDGLAYSLTRNGTGDARELWRAPTTSADELVRDAIELTSDRRTTRLGKVLAPMGVRYVAIPTTLGPDEGGSGTATAVTASLRHALADQLDLARLRSARGLVVYENLAWLPARSVVADGDGRVPLGPGDPSISALRSDVEHARPLRSDRRAPAGTVLFAEQYDSRWKATGTSGDLRHGRAFGWANGYVLRRPSEVEFHFTGQWERWVLVLLQAVIWAAVVSRWRRTRGRRQSISTPEAGEPKRVERMPREPDTEPREYEWDPA
jgi:hypothetical protein